ncbi:MAG: hypothetical protein ACHQYP_02250 [Nitrospiria bacterium]
MLSVIYRASSFLSLICFLLTACGLPSGSNNSSSFAVSSSPVLRLDQSSLNAINPQVAVDESDRVFVVWQDNSITFTYSTDGGKTFQSPVNIPGSSGGSYPRITTDGNGNAYVIWQASTQFLLNYSTTNIFQAFPVVITSSVCSSQSSQSPVPQADIVNTGSVLAITWAQQSPCSNPSSYENMLDFQPLSNPATLPAPVNVFTDSSFAGYPKISNFGANPYLVYLQTSVSDLVLLEYSTTSSPQKSFPVNTKNSNAAIPLSSSLSVDSIGNSFVAWEASTPQGGGVDIFFNTLPAKSSSFNLSPHNLTNNGASKGSAVSIDSSQYVYVAFFSRPSATPKTYDVFLERSSNGGNSFTDPFNVSNTAGTSASYAPGLAITGKNAYVVWDDNSFTSGSSQIFFQKLTLD